MRYRALLIAVIWSCAATAGASRPVTLWHGYRAGERKALEQIAAQIRSETGIEISLLAVPIDAFPRRLAAAIPRGHGPDLFIYAHERIGEWVRARRIAPATGIRPSDYLAETLPPVRFEGKFYGWPLAFKSLALFYRTDKTPRAPKTTSELIEIARRFTRPGQGRYGLAYESGSIYHHAPWLHGFGGAMFDEKGKPALNSRPFAQSLAFARRLTRVEKIVPPSPSGSVVAMTFNQGLVPFAINGPWFLGKLRRSVPFAVAPLPIVDETGQRARPFLTVEAVFLSSRSPQPLRAQRVAARLASTPAAIVRAVVGRQAVANGAAWNDPRVSADRILAGFRAQLRFAVPMPNRPEMNTLWEPAAQALRSVLRGDAPPRAAGRLAQRRVEVLLAPPPRPRSPVPYAIVAGALALLGAIWLVRRARRQWPEMRRHGRAYRYVAPAAVAMGVLVFFPAVVGVVLAFFVHRSGEYSFVGAQNFLEIVASKDYGVTDPWSFYYTFAVTTVWTVVNVALHLGLGVALALWLSRPWMRLRWLFRILLILPWAVPNYITALMWKGMFHAQFGAINELLSFVGIERVSWFDSFWPAFSANVVTNAWLGFPFMMVVTLGALQSIPKEVQEAAAIDGATSWQRFWRVTLPLLKPALIPAAILGTVWTFNMFNVVWLVSGGEPDGATDILVSESYRWAFQRGERYGYAAAYAVLIFLILLGYSWLSKRWTARVQA